MNGPRLQELTSLIRDLFVFNTGDFVTAPGGGHSLCVSLKRKHAQSPNADHPFKLRFGKVDGSYVIAFTPGSITAFSVDGSYEDVTLDDGDLLTDFPTLVAGDGNYLAYLELSFQGVSTELESGFFTTTDMPLLTATVKVTDLTSGLPANVPLGIDRTTGDFEIDTGLFYFRVAQWTATLDGSKLIFSNIKQWMKSDQAVMLNTTNNVLLVPVQ